MDKTKKEIVLLVGSIFVAVIFLTSFVGSGNGPVPSGGNQSAQKNVTAVFASGHVNATVEGYGTDALIKVLNGSLYNATNDFLIGLEDNGSVATYNQLGSQFNVYLSSSNSYSLQRLLQEKIGSGFTLSSKEYVLLPKTAVLHVGNQTVPVYFGTGTYTVTPASLSAINSTVSIYVNAIIAFENGTYQVYNSNVTLRSA
jgi:hypothetical protein